MKVSESLKKLLNESGENPNSLSIKVGIPQPTIFRMLSGETVEPRRSNLEKIAKFFGVKVEHLYDSHINTKSVNKIKNIKTDEDPPEDDDVVVEVVDIELAAGSGSNTVEFVETKDHHTYKLGFLKKLGIKDHSKVKRCKVRGNSMEPTLFNGDTVSINTEDTALIDDAVYAIVVSDQLRIKRLRRTRDGGILIKSDNSTQWPDEFIPPNEADTVKIIGRVFDKSGRGGLGF